MERKRIFSLSLILILTLCFIGCAQNQDTADLPSNVYAFTDDIGNRVELTGKPERVAVLFSSYAEIWQIAGGNIDITVAESIERVFTDKDVILVDDKSGHTAIDAETLIASRPDFVIGTADHDIQVQTAALCRNAGIPCALFRVEDIDSYLKVLKIFTDILGTPESYTEYEENIKNKTEMLLSKTKELTENKNILFIRCGSSERSAKAKTSENNFVCTMLSELGTHNIAESAPILLDTLSLEEIVLRNPELIFISPMGDEDACKKYIDSLFKKGGWSELTAVKNNNYHFLPKELFHYEPNAKWYDAYRYLAEIIYTETRLDD